VTAAIVVVPLTLESAVFGSAGGAAWQGRYGLPLAVGVPIVAAMAIASSGRGRQLAEPRLFIGAGVMLVVAHILAFAQNLRRYTVGADGEIQFTDALALMVAEGTPAHGIVYRGVRFDTGQPLGYVQAVVQMTLRQNDIGEAFGDWLKDYVSRLP